MKNSSEINQEFIMKDFSKVFHYDLFLKNLSKSQGGLKIYQNNENSMKIKGNQVKSRKFKENQVKFQ